MEQEIERVLRAAPRPAPPAGLKEQLIAQVRLPAAETPARPLAHSSWLRRWWPILLPGSVSLACAVVLTMQQMEIRDLKHFIRDLARDTAAKEHALPAPAPTTNRVPVSPDAAARTQQEIARLKGLAAQLATEITQLEQLGAENGKLRAQLAAAPVGSLRPEDADALAKARERAESIVCVNNLKQLGLAAKVWAVDNGGVNPPDILSMTNEMSTPKILACPGDRVRQAAKDWASYTSANCSYEYMAPSAPSTDPWRVMFRCPIHGHVTLCDGSVQVSVVKDHPEWFVRPDGKVYLTDPTQPIQDVTAYTNRLERIIQRVPGPVPAPSTNPPSGGSNP